MKSYIRHIPNLLTLFRAFLTPVFAWAVFYWTPLPRGALAGLIVFVIASLTDFLDGQIARRAHVVSDFGKIMDTLADKILVITALFILYLLPGHMVASWVLFAVVLREILVTAMRQYHTNRGVVIPANIWGKCKTFLQMTGIIGALLYYVGQGYYPQIFAVNTERWYLAFRIVFWLLALVTVASGITYVKPYPAGEKKP